MSVNFIPAGCHTVTPYLTVQDAAGLIEFLVRVFDAKETERMMRPDGTVGHAEVRIGDSVVMIGGGSTPRLAALYMYVPDVDATYRRALEAGAPSVSEPNDQFYGDRHGAVKDPAGNDWWIATHIEDVAPEEMTRRAKASMK